MGRPTAVGAVTMRVALHDYRSDPALPQKDGVNLAHENIALLLRQATGTPARGLDVRFHDLNQLLADPAQARAALGDVDCVVSNVGPHAHYYFGLREQLGARFRIVRDVRTAIWSSYLLQEHLCAPLLREGDVLLAASAYTRTLYRHLYPHLQQQPIRRCYPLTVGFPSQRLPRPVRTGGPTVLGYLGRLSEDKNLPDLVELLIRLNEAEPGGYRLLACGDVHSESCQPARIRARLVEQLGRSDLFEHLPARPNAEIWAVLARMDVLVFPSTSNLETLGRVLIEASYAGVPVVCGAHAAAPELVPDEALVAVDYRYDTAFDAHYDHSLGRTSVDGLLQAILQRRYRTSDCHDDYRRHSGYFLDIVHDPFADDGGDGPDMQPLHPSPRAFIQALQLQRPGPLDMSQTLQQIDALTHWFLVLQRRGSAARAQALADLQRLSAFPERTARFIARSAGTRCDFSNVGGIDVELCNVARFFPTFTLRRPAGR